MRPALVVKLLSWLLLILGLLGLAAAVIDSPSAMPAISLIGLSMAGFAFLAYLDHKR